MATLIFVCLKAGKVIETPYDWMWCCLLIAIEGPGYLNAIRLWRLNRH